MPARAESMATPHGRSLHQSASGSDSLRGHQHVLRCRHLSGADCQRVESPAVQEGESGSAHHIRLRGIVCIRSKATTPCHEMLLTRILLSYSACIASAIRLVKFAQKPPVILGAVDETWDYYSLNLVWYVTPERDTILFSGSVLESTSEQCTKQ